MKTDTSEKGLETLIVWHMTPLLKHRLTLRVLQHVNKSHSTLFSASTLHSHIKPLPIIDNAITISGQTLIPQSRRS